MKKIIFVTCTFLSILLIASAFKTEERKYKNLKILPKNIGETELDSIMKSFTVALNVKCNFCHIRNEETKTWDYANDEKGHKRIAREMLVMTKKINDKYFKEDNKGRKIPMVTCYTCHNGHKEPYFMPVVENSTK